jgi:two-component system nitrogen regulation sensor histidine kinase NtrY
MALTLRQPSSVKPVQPMRRGPNPSPQGRKPFRDNTRLIVIGIIVLIAVLAGLLVFSSRSATLAPDFLTEVVLYALSATNLTILVALVFVLARNIVKLLVEKQKALPFARFRAKLVAVLLGMTLIPAVLVLLVGSSLISNSVQGWFNAPLDQVLSSANAIAGDYYQERQLRVAEEAARLAGELRGVDLATDTLSVRGLVAPEIEQQQVDLIEVYRIDRAPGGVQATRIVTVSAPVVPVEYAPTQADRLAAQASNGDIPTPAVEPIANRGELIRSIAAIRPSADAPPTGIVIVSEYLTGEMAARARQMTGAFEDYQQLRVLRQPLTGVYLSFFLMLTLMILVAATWMGLYLAKRITRPIQTLAAAASEIGAGHLDHRVVAETKDEFGSLIEAFNKMAGDLATSRRRLERSGVDLERKHQVVEGRRRYVETILQRIAAGVISVDTAGRIGTVNAAAARLLALDPDVTGRQVADVFGEPELKPLRALIDAAGGERADLPPQEVAITRGGRELHLTVTATSLRRDDGVADGMVLVLDDVTPLIRAQKVAAWREVARRLAHEIKNPLTPIRLSAERMRRHFTGAPDQTRALVDECTTTIVGEVESLKDLVDEFSQFARMPAPRAQPTDLHALLDDVVGLYRGIFTDVELRPRFAASLPKVSVDPEQIRRVMINLIDNAIEAMEQRGTIDIETQHAPADNLVRIVVADNGPGIPAAERDKLFLPYYSTKQRGSGLGLAIVRRIVAEHGGSIEVTDNAPRGTRFAVELPC